MSAQITEFALEDSYLNPLASAELYAMAGDFDSAFQLLRTLAATSANWMLANYLRSPFLANLHADSRWIELLELAGIAQHQLEDVTFNPKLR